MKESEKRKPLHPEEAVTSLLLIRHGHTKPTEDGRLYTDPACDLTERGVDQARALATWVAARVPDLVLSSSALRVVSTASIICNAIGVAPRILDGFGEWRVGHWENLSYWDIKERYPDEYAEWSSDPITRRPPAGESISDLCERIKQDLQPVLKAHPGKRVVLVTHAGVIRAILLHALGMPVQNFWRLSISVASISRVDFSSSFATVHFAGLRLEDQQRPDIR